MRLIEILAAATLLASFFMPWSAFFAAKGSGLALAQNPDFQGAALFVLPALALIVLLCLLARRRVRWLQFLVGLVPLVSAVIGLYQLGQQGGGGSIGTVFETVKPFIDWGVYVAIGSGLLLTFLSLFKNKSAQSN